jgi:hypothetical protein
MKDAVLDDHIPSCSLFFVLLLLVCVIYKVSSVMDEHNVRTVAIHPAAARGQDLPPNISVDVFRAAIMDSLSVNTV